MQKTTHHTTDLFFRVGLIIKGVDSIFEVVGGVLLMMPMKIARFLAVLSHHEVYRHHDVLAGKIDHLSDSILTHSSVGEAIYLMVHGFAKVVLIYAIFRDQKWGYKGLIVVLSLFATIEIVRAFTAHEIMTGVLSLFDIFMIYLILKEYRVRFGPRLAVN